MADFEPLAGEVWDPKEDVLVVQMPEGRQVLVPRSVRRLGGQGQAVFEHLQGLALAHDRLLDQIAGAVDECRDVGLSWDAIGFAVGTTGEAVRKRYGGE